MNLHDYNHALFQNMMFFMDIVWEINMLTGTVVILQDSSEPDKDGVEFSYKDTFRDYIENKVSRDELSAFQQYMDFKNLRALKQEISFDIHLHQKDGSLNMYRIVLTPAFEGEMLSCVYLGARNMQSEIRQQEAVREAYEAAERANAAKSEFLNKISHDIRTPMNAIIGMTAIAEKHQDNRERVAECLKKISLSSKYLLALVDEMLDMSMIESGKMKLQEEEINLPELLENLEILLEIGMKEKGHEFSLQVLRLEHEKVWGDRRRIDQIFMNLIDNAAKYTMENGKIQVTLEEKPTNTQGIGCYEIVVEDNGIGMEQEFLEHMFEPFVRAKDKRVERVQGSGLGLAIMNSVVRMMNGAVDVKSTPGKGTKVVVRIFLKLLEEENVEFPQLANAVALVVNRDEALCREACEVMAGLGVQSEWALTEKGALKRIEEHHRESMDYRTVILDRGITGKAEFINLIAKMNRIGDGLTAIVVSSDSDWTDIEADARAAGAVAFIANPCSRFRLIQLFKLLTGQKEEVDQKSPLEALAERNFHGRRALMVEDNESNAEIICEILKIAGLEVEQAWNGQEAVKKILTVKDWYYDIVFMDIQMPVMDGYEAVKTIRGLEREYAQEVPILAMSANAFAEDVQASLEAGMNEHISKPIDFRKLEDALCRWLPTD